MKLKTSVVAAALTLVLASGLGACGAAQPTSQLVDARHTFERARTARGAELVPDRVLEARQALAKAERIHADEPGSSAERHYAYLASRKALLAMAQSELALARRNHQLAERRFDELQNSMRVQAQRELRDTRSQLATTRQSLQRVRVQLRQQGAEQQRRALEQQRQQLEAEQADLEKQLAAERAQSETNQQARIDAEKRAAAALESLREIATVKAEQQDIIITLTGEVLFRVGESQLIPTARRSLERVAEALKEQGEDKFIIVEGHADSRGAEAMNQQLSEARARAVSAFLVDRGVNGRSIQAIGRGEHEPIASNDTPEGRANNRRVEIIIRNFAPAFER